MTLRILALDGGGIKGSFTAGVLAASEKETGQRCVDHFDLISGASTGGIITLGLGLSAQEIVDFYTNHGLTIFPSTSLARRWSGVVRHLFRPKHSHLLLCDTLTQVFGEKKLGEQPDAGSTGRSRSLHGQTTRRHRHTKHRHNQRSHLIGPWGGRQEGEHRSRSRAIPQWSARSAI